jgi:hypothetical protein
MLIDGKVSQGTKENESWRIDPDRRQDRANGEVKVYKLSPEELKKYINIKPSQKLKMAGVESMARRECEENMAKKLNITNEELIEIYKQHKTPREAAMAIAQKRGITIRQAENLLFHRKIKELATQEHAPEAETNIDADVKIMDSGDRTKFDTGAVRDMHQGKGRCDLLPPKALLRLARHFESRAIKYGVRNWEKGLPVSSFIDSAIRHTLKYMDGWTDEDHLIAAVWNLICAAEMEEIHPEMIDLPRRAKA